MISSLLWREKNPQGVIKAFKQAFPENTDSVELIIKTVNAHLYPHMRTLLDDLIDGDLRVQIRDGFVNQEEMKGLIRSADAYVSLHRAEGLGLGLAEAMYMGKPTIATGYSGNTEFMNSSNSMLVPYSLDDIPILAYPHGLNTTWAEPDLTFAAEAMKKIAADDGLRGNLVKNAFKDMRKYHSYALSGVAMMSALEEIYAK